MNQDPIAARVRRVVREIVPEADVERLDPNRSFRDQIDMDSVEYLNLVLSLEATFGIHIPDADYPKLSTLNGCIAYLKHTLAEPPRAVALAGSCVL